MLGAVLSDADDVLAGSDDPAAELLAGTSTGAVVVVPLATASAVTA